MTKVKICGLMNQKSVEACCQFGADYLGFVFAESRRQVTPAYVKEITQTIPKNIKKVGVFVSPTKEKVEKTVLEARLDMVQIHGEQLFSDCRIPMIRAQSVYKKSQFELSADYLLLDAPPQEFQGGNGTTFSWELVEPGTVPHEKLWIAGGLTEKNVQQAISYFRPMAVDVSSGVETKGKKDIEKIRRFITKVKENDYVSTTR